MFSSILEQESLKKVYSETNDEIAFYWIQSKQASVMNMALNI